MKRKKKKELSYIGRLKDANSARVLREKLLQEQLGIDPILHITITNPVLDHQHFPPYNCRKVLQNEVNTFEGKVFNAYRRYIRHLSNKPLPEVLRELATYLEADYTNNIKHHTAIKDELRPFRRSSSEVQERLLKSLDIEPAKNSAKRVKQMRSALLNNQITYEKLIASL